MRLHVCGRDACEPGELPRVRRDDDVAAFRAGQAIGLGGKSVERIRIEHQRDARPLDQRVNESNGARRHAEPGANGNDVVRPVQQAFQFRDRNAAVLIGAERFRHVLRRHRGQHRLAPRRRGDRHQPRARPQRAHPGQMRGPAPALGPRNHQHVAVVAFM